MKMSIVATAGVGVKARHDAAEAICPVAWAKSLTFAREALNDEIGRFGGRLGTRKSHQVARLSWGRGMVVSEQAYLHALLICDASSRRYLTQD